MLTTCKQSAESDCLHAVGFPTITVAVYTDIEVDAGDAVELAIDHLMSLGWEMDEAKPEWVI